MGEGHTYTWSKLEDGGTDYCGKIREYLISDPSEIIKFENLVYIGQRFKRVAVKKSILKRTLVSFEFESWKTGVF